jgi:hypothetical protein
VRDSITKLMQDLGAPSECQAIDSNCPESREVEDGYPEASGQFSKRSQRDRGLPDGLVLSKGSCDLRIIHREDGPPANPLASAPQRNSRQRVAFVGRSGRESREISVGLNDDAEIGVGKRVLSNLVQHM